MKAALLNTISSILAMAVGAVMIPIMSHMLPADQLGIAVSFMTIRDISVYFCTLSVHMAVHRGMLDFREEKHPFNSSILLFGIACTAGLFLITLPFQRQISGLLGFSPFLLSCLFMSVILLFARYIMHYYLTFHNRAWSIFFINILSAPISQLLSILFIYFLEDTQKYLGRIFGIDSLSVLMGGVFIPLLLWKGRCTFRWKHIRYALAISVPLVPHLAAQTVLSQSDLLMIRYMDSDMHAGLFSMAYTIGSLLYALMLQVMNVWSPWVYRRIDEENLSAVRENAKYILLMGLVLSMGLLAIAPEMIRLFLSENYYDCIYLLPPLVVGMFFQFVYLFFYDVEYFHKKTRYIALSSVGTAAVNILLNYLFIGRYGYVAAAYTTAASYLLLTLAHYFCMRRIEPRRIYDLKQMRLVAVGVVLSAAAMFLLIDRPLLRYGGFLLALLILGLVYRRKALEYWKMLRVKG